MFKKKSNLNIKFIGSKKTIMNVSETSYANGVKIYCWNDTISVSIGKYCSLADNITIIAGGEHDKNWVSTFPFFLIQFCCFYKYSYFRIKRYRYKR